MNTKKHKHKNKKNPSDVNLQEKSDTKEVPQESLQKNEPSAEIVKEKNEPKTELDQKPIEEQQLEKVESKETVDVKDEVETPTKPKRNKSKKKKQEPEYQEESTKAEVPQLPTEIKVQQVTNVELDPDHQKEPMDTVNPRKKKNKKKNQEKEVETKTEESKIPQKQELIPSVESATIDTEVTELFSSTPEPLGKKKKNKKKKRNDSERSDKSEDIQCTAAFQKLLTEDDSIRDMGNEGKHKKDEGTVEMAKVLEASIVDSPKPEKTDSSSSKIPDEVTEKGKDEDKSKRKTKKDKKHLQIEQQQPQTSEEKSEEKTIQQSEQVIKQKSEELIIPTQPLPTKELVEKPEPTTQKEESPKLKAKIAKPVEKKRKEKENITTQEPVSESIKEEVKNVDSEIKPIEIEHKDKPVEKKQKEKDFIQPDNVIRSENTTIQEPISESIKEDAIKTESEIKPIEIEHKLSKINLKDESNKSVTDNIKVPDSNTMGKKRGKSPKPSKETTKDPKNILKVKPTEELKKTGDVSIKSLDQKEEKCDITESQSKQTQDQKPVLSQKTEPSETISPEVVPKIDEKNVPEEKQGKKKKKQPKIPIQSEVPDLLDVPQTSVTKDEPKEHIVEKESKTEKEEIMTEKHEECKIPPLEDIEVRSVRTDESEGSSCDVTPDVHFIRSSSHQLLDDNNNSMMIQEVRTEDFKFNEPLTLPIIEGSGETPIRTPDVITIRMQKKDKSQERDETIKSKMMEVNKDMEELKMSIEKSLAGFSSLEKVEQESEKKIEQKPKNITEKPTTEVTTPEIKTESTEPESKCKPTDTPFCPSRKDKKGKNKKKGKQDTTASTSATQSSSTTETSSTEKTKEKKQEKTEKDDKKSESSESKGKQQSDSLPENNSPTDSEVTKNIEDATVRSESTLSDSLELEYEPIDSFEDALTSSVDDVNQTFEIIAEQADTETKEIHKKLSENKPAISITDTEDKTKNEDDTKDTKRTEKTNPITPPKNLLGHNDIPVPSNKTDYKKERNKTPNERQARVKIKDGTDIEKISKESQTENKMKRNIENSTESFSHIVKNNEEYVYKYSFRKVFLQSACHVCKKDLLKFRVPCSYCNLVFYCCAKHKDEDYSQHQALCFAVSTIVHLKDQKHIYADAKSVIGQDYRILRMQMIVACEKVLKRRLVPWEQEAMLYPRMCADTACREWRQNKLKDCEGCGQLSYCSDNPDHLPKSHQRWCKSYSLYAKLVCYQQTKGRLEPRLPTKVLTKTEVMGKMNDVLAALYEEKIDMNDIQYAALTQVATAPLTAVYYHQLYTSKKEHQISNGTVKQPFVIHVVGAELQFEADALNKWEVFFLHLRPDLQDLKVVLVSPALNPGNLPLDLLGNIKVCVHCKNNNRNVTFSFQDQSYSEYRTSDVFINPDLICAFNPSIQRSSSYNIKDPWPSTVCSILKLKTPFIITAYTLPELRKDIAKIKDFTDLDFKVVAEPMFNNFASVRPDRNFITDDEMPLLFKNYCVSLICGC